jgi:methyltransferase (TIGR00027 family)
MLYFARDWHFGHLVPAQAAALYARFLYVHSPRIAQRFAHTESPLFRQLVAALEYLTLPGIMLYYAVRKRAVEDTVRAGIEAGVKQVVVLTAGFDTLAVRLHREFPQVSFIEVDRLGMQAIKRRVLTGQWAAAANLSFVAADLDREPLESKLLDSAYVSGMPTLFIIEGLLSFMTDDKRDALFDFINVLGGASSRVVFTFMEREPDGRIHFRGATWLARLWFQLRGERFRWGPSRDELEEYLVTHGFTLQEVLTAAEFRVRYLDGNPDVPLAAGEDVALAQVMPTEKS